MLNHLLKNSIQTLSKKRTLFLLCLAVAAAAPGHAVKVELRGVSDHRPTTKIDFGRIPSNRGDRTCSQYIEINYPADQVHREIRVYTNNRHFKGKGSKRNGLISSDQQNRIPISWISFSSAQQDSSLILSSPTESSWGQLIDLNDTDFDQNKNLAAIPQNSRGTSLIYLKVNFPPNIPGGTYTTKLTVEIINKVSDKGQPKIVHRAIPKIQFGKKPVIFSAAIDEDVSVTSAVFHYRHKGETWKSILLNLTQNPDNPFQWLGEAALPTEEIKPGILEYCFEASDGSYTSRAGTMFEPYETELLEDFKAVTKQISPEEGGTVTIFDGDSRFGSTELELPKGSLDTDIKISAKKLDPAALPALNGETALSACEFHPERPVRFNQRAQLSLKYNDENGDGTIDETNVQVADLKIFWWDNFEWRYVGGNLQETRRTVTVPLTHLSTFALFPAAGVQGDFKPKEKIITPALQDGFNDFAVFDGLDSVTDPFQIHFFDVTGRKIRTLTQFGRWDGRDDNGNIVETGVYIYQVHLQGRIINGTITVAQ